MKKKTIIYEYKEIKLVLYNGNKVDGSGLYGKLISRFLVLLVYYYFNFILEQFIVKLYVLKLNGIIVIVYKFYDGFKFDNLWLYFFKFYKFIFFL